MGKLPFTSGSKRSRILILVALFGLLTAACDTINPAVLFSRILTPARAERLMPHVLAKLPHDTTAFTEGLLLRNGTFYESSGLYGKSNLRLSDPKTGRVLRQLPLTDNYFAEGIALTADNRLIQLSWKEQTAFVYNPDTLARIATYTYTGEGWGLCYDDDTDAFYMSNGSASLAVRDAKTFAVTRQIPVTLDDEPLLNLNELECVGDVVYANVWLTDQIVRIDKTTGIVTGLIDASGLLSAQERIQAGADGVLNGIAYDPQDNTFYITGKLWPWLFDVQFVPDNRPIPVQGAATPSS